MGREALIKRGIIQSESDDAYFSESDDWRLESDESARESDESRLESDDSRPESDECTSHCVRVQLGRHLQFLCKIVPQGLDDLHEYDQDNDGAKHDRQIPLLIAVSECQVTESACPDHTRHCSGADQTD